MNQIFYFINNKNNYVRTQILMLVAPNLRYDKISYTHFFKHILSHKLVIVK